MKYVLIIGGAGYIGSHMLLKLYDEGCHIVVVDNLSTGNASSVLYGELIVGDCRDYSFLSSVFRRYNFDCVMHFGALSIVGESTKSPYEYYDNNCFSQLNLLRCMRDFGVKRLIFSSTAAVYGTPSVVPICETDMCFPVNPYGRSKMISEQFIFDCCCQFGISYVVFRYFNAAGCDRLSRVGEKHFPETHLIPSLLNFVAGVSRSFNVYGNTFATADGTCVRDFVHVVDICEAHWLGFIYLINGGASSVFNLGNQHGYSVMEVINAAEMLLDVKINYVVMPARDGDPPVLIANSDKARSTLGWSPLFPEIDVMLYDAWQYIRLNS